MKENTLGQQPDLKLTKPTTLRYPQGAQSPSIEEIRAAVEKGDSDLADMIRENRRKLPFSDPKMDSTRITI